MEEKNLKRGLKFDLKFFATCASMFVFVLISINIEEIINIFQYRAFGVDGVSLSAFVIKLNITTTKQSRIGPNIAPSHPSKNIPPAIERPVK